MVDICSPNASPEAGGTRRVTLVGQRGFLRTPGYPTTPYPNNADCQVIVEAPHAFQRIHLDAVEIELEKNETGCSDWLETFDGLRSMTLCGRRTRRRLGTSEHQSYRVRFRSNARVRLKGFWIYYEGRYQHCCIRQGNLIFALLSLTVRIFCCVVFFIYF